MYKKWLELDSTFKDQPDKNKFIYYDHNGLLNFGIPVGTLIDFIWLIWLIFQLFISVMMLNFIISIVTQSYDSVIANQVNKIYYFRCKMNTKF